MNQKIDIVGDVNKIAQYIPWAKKQWVLREGLWYKDLKECLIEFKNISNSGYIRFFVKTSSGFVFHPRSSIYPNGINTDTHKKIDTPYPTFPLYDDDKGTMLLENVDGWQVDVPDGDNYGVHAWASEDEIVSWRGWPSITLGLDREVAVDGVTQLDVQTAYNTYYTPLSSYIYSGGEKIPAPGKVRGAGISDIGLVAVTTVNYTQYDIAGFANNSVNPEGGVGGYYDELYVQVGSGTYIINGVEVSAFLGITNQAGESLDGWLRIGYRVSPINNLPVWFNLSGKQAVADEGVWDWSISDRVITSKFTARVDNSKHEYTIYGAPNPWKALADSNWQTMYMLTKFGKLSYFRDDRTTANKESSSTKEVVKVYYQARPEPTNYYIDVNRIPYNYIVSLSAVGFKGGPYTWAGGAVPNDDFGMEATIDVTNLCGTVQVSVTDACGYSASVDVAGKNGRFVFTSQVAAGPNLCYPNYFDTCNGNFQPVYGDAEWAAILAAAQIAGATSVTLYRYYGGSQATDACGTIINPGDVTCTFYRSWVC